MKVLCRAVLLSFAFLVHANPGAGRKQPALELSYLIKEMAQDFYPKLSDEEVDKIVRKADLNGDGKLQPVEFYKYKNFIKHIPIKYFMTGARAYFTEEVQSHFPKASDEMVDKLVNMNLAGLSLRTDR